MSPDTHVAPRNGTSRTLFWGFIALAIAVLALTVLLVVAFVRITNQSATQASQHLALIEGCNRENVKQADDNASHLADFEVYSFVAARFLVPTHTETPAQVKVTREFAGSLRRAVASKTWTPLTNCQRAVNQSGAKYAAPAPIPFSRRLPLAAALPKGSVFARGPRAAP